ncbi:hypothetical protein ABZ412_33070 [Nocardia sp. NPDC005746]|uniref:hypothetical protein n=1 Tax=Nocardia sp. NPDC005746 TaxID=3157062 RepID=UPI0033CB02E6
MTRARYPVPHGPSGYRARDRLPEHGQHQICHHEHFGGVMVLGGGVVVGGVQGGATVTVLLPWSA